MNSHAFCRTSRSSSPGRPSGLAYSLPPEAMREDALDPTPRPETSSEGPNATRPQNVVPAVKTRLLFRALQPPNRTSLSTSYKIHGDVYRVYLKPAQLAREKR